jgi:hypothetical protein
MYPARIDKGGKLVAAAAGIIRPVRVAIVIPRLDAVEGAT